MNNSFFEDLDNIEMFLETMTNEEIDKKIEELESIKFSRIYEEPEEKVEKTLYTILLLKKEKKLRTLLEG